MFPMSESVEISVEAKFFGRDAEIRLDVLANASGLSVIVATMRRLGGDSLRPKLSSQFGSIDSKKQSGHSKKAVEPENALPKLSA
jgi:hypothetical protein